MSETAVAKKKHNVPSRNYDAGEINRCLIALVAASGNCRLASRNLAKDGIKIDHSTLSRWKNHKRRDEYLQLRAEFLPRIREQQADAHRALEAQQLEASEEALAIIRSRLPQMDDRDVINAMGKSDIGSGIHGEKAQLYDNQPTQIVQKNASDILRSLKDKFGLTFEGEATEDTAALEQAPE